MKTQNEMHVNIQADLKIPEPEDNGSRAQGGVSDSSIVLIRQREGRIQKLTKAEDEKI